MSVYSDNAKVFQAIEDEAYRSGYMAALANIEDGMTSRKPYELHSLIETLRTNYDTEEQ